MSTADPGRPMGAAASGAARSAVVAIVLGIVALAFAAVAAYAVWDTATITYQLPPSPGAPDPNIHEHFHAPALIGLVPVALAALLALAGTVLGIVGLVRKRARWPITLLPVAALPLAALGPFLAATVDPPVF